MQQRDVFARGGHAVQREPVKPRRTSRRRARALAAIASALCVAASLACCNEPAEPADTSGVEPAIAKAVCAAMASSCPCNSKPPLTEAECESRAVSSSLAGLLATGRELGLELDEACVATLASYAGQTTCLLNEAGPRWCEDVMPCSILHGTLAEGAPCETSDNGVFSDCAQSLICDRDERTCRPMCDPSPPGEGQPCATSRIEICGPDLYCYGSSCVKPAVAGESCAAAPCIVGTSCDGSACVERGHVGAPCSADVDCLSNNCNLEVCAPVEAPVCTFA